MQTALFLVATIGAVAVGVIKGKEYFVHSPSVPTHDAGKPEEDTETGKADTSQKPEGIDAGQKATPQKKKEPSKPVTPARETKENTFDCEITRLTNAARDRIRFAASCKNVPGPVSVNFNETDCKWRGKGRKKTLQGCTVVLKTANLASSATTFKPERINRPKQLGRIKFTGKKQ